MATYSEIKETILDHGINAVRAYKNHFGQFDYSHFEDCFECEFDYRQHMEEYLIDLFIDCYEIPEHLQRYLDEKMLLRDLFIADYSFEEIDNKYYLFRQC